MQQPLSETRLIGLAGLGLAGFSAWFFQPVTPAAALHLSLAMALMPLMLGVIIHLTPVLTRTAPEQGWRNRLPFVALLGGGMAALTLLGVLPWPFLHPAALTAITAAAAVLGWTRQRQRASLGGGHPGLVWYQAALAMLLAALPAMPLGLLLPEGWNALRLLHLHLNLLGFIGLTAIGTLQVLLPTAARRPDPEAGLRLRRDLRWAVAGTVLVAGGAPCCHPLAWAGGVAWLWVMGRFLGAIRRQSLYQPPGAGRSLTLASVGFGLLLLLGLAHGTGLMSAAPSLPLFATLFLFPLVTGALTHFLPLWRHPGAAQKAQEALRGRLVRGANLRMALFAAGSAAVIGEARLGLGIAGLGVAWFMAQAGLAMFRPGSGETPR